MNKEKRIGRKVLCLVISLLMVLTLVPRMPASLAYAETGDTPTTGKFLADNENGTYNEHGIGYLVEVYDGKVVFRARNFDKGVYVPEYDIKINLYIKKVKLSKKTYKYDGKAKTPKVTVKASNGKTVSKKYYTVKYQKGRRKPGKYKVTVKFKGKYKKAGTITKTFTIKK